MDVRSKVRASPRSRQGIGWVRQRLGAGGWPEAIVASALVLVLGIGLLVLLMWGLGLLARGGVLAGVDDPLYRWFVRHRAGWATAVMNRVTAIGDYPPTTVVSLLAGVGLALYWRRAMPLLLLATVPVEKYLQQGIGSLVHTPRPPAALSIGPAGAFPSGGSARVVLIAGMLAWLLVGRPRGQRPAVAAWTVVALLALVEGWSRLYLGRHWVADVLGGWIFGTLLLAVLVTAATLVALPSARRLPPARRGWAASPGRAVPRDRL
jgi:membrane-associated phospholipid phosphatase